MPFLALIHIPDHTIPPATIAAEIEVRAGARVVGIFDYPNRSELKCSGTCTVKHTGAWVRDPRGFMKCQICGYRSKRLRRWLINALFDFLGANLYPEAPAAFRTPDGYGDSTR